MPASSRPLGQEAPAGVPQSPGLPHKGHMWVCAPQMAVPTCTTLSTSSAIPYLGTLVHAMHAPCGLNTPLARLHPQKPPCTALLARHLLVPTGRLCRPVPSWGTQTPSSLGPCQCHEHAQASSSLALPGSAVASRAPGCHIPPSPSLPFSLLGTQAGLCSPQRDLSCLRPHSPGLIAWSEEGRPQGTSLQPPASSCSPSPPIHPSWAINRYTSRGAEFV